MRLAPFKTPSRLCAVSLILAFAGTAAYATDDAALSALLKKQTQAFSDAGQKGDAATIDRYLDPDVVFTNETGAIATKKDLVEGTTPTPANAPKRRIEVTNWALRRQGDVATATFIDKLTQEFHGQTLILQFQSTETWAKRADGWKMIASHTMNVQHAPQAIHLSPAELDPYVGVYQLDPTFVVKITRRGDGLEAKRQWRGRRSVAGRDQGRAVHAERAQCAQAFSARRRGPHHRLHQPARRQRSRLQEGGIRTEPGALVAS